MTSNGVTIRSRLNLKIDEDLKNWIMAYARRRKTTVTSVICAYFVELREAEQKEVEEVEQI